jgi:hypothetical protein
MIYAHKKAVLQSCSEQRESFVTRLFYVLINQGVGEANKSLFRRSAHGLLYLRPG